MTLCWRPGRRADGSPDRPNHWRAGAAVLLIAAATAACSPRSDRAADVEIRGTDPNGGAPGIAAGAPATMGAPAPGIGAAPDARGIVSYDGYQTVVAGEGDTVAALAERVGLSASELAAYNGLTPSHQMLAGDELVLPPRPDGYGAASTGGSGGMVVAAAPSVSAPAGAAGTIEQAPLPAAGPPPDGWSPEIAAAAIERSTGVNPDGSLGAPPSAAEPVPPAPAPRRDLESPDLDQYQTGAAAPAAAVPAETPPETAGRVAAVAPNLRLQKPVDGPVAIPFNKGAGPTRNDGVDFAAPGGAPVIAAADGEVALVSQSLGGLGTIVLVRHPDDLLTVYGRIDGVSVGKGDVVRQGQQIGVVSNAAAPDEPRMHFEVRRGAESLDPMQFL